MLGMLVLHVEDESLRRMDVSMAFLGLMKFGAHHLLEVIARKFAEKIHLLIAAGLCREATLDARSCALTGTCLLYFLQGDLKLT